MHVDEHGLPALPKSPEERVRPIITLNKTEIKIKEELQKGSEKLRQEASQNLQTFGGSFNPDFYGGKARMEFSTLQNKIDETVNLHFCFIFNRKDIKSYPICLISQRTKINGECF